MKKEIQSGNLKIGQKPAACAVIADISGRLPFQKLNRDADLVELRADLWDINRSHDVIKTVKKIRARLSCPLILTLRAKEERPPGSNGTNWTVAEKKIIYNQTKDHLDAVDIEIRKAHLFTWELKHFKMNRKKVILSYHNFRRTLTKSEFRRKIKDAMNRGADIVKIAVTPGSLREISVLKQYTRSESARVPLIVIGMGRVAQSTRYDLLDCGSLLTYVSIGRATAPGQITLDDFSRNFKKYR